MVSSEALRTASLVFVTSFIAVGAVFLTSVFSVFLVFSLRAALQFIVRLITVCGEVIVALVAATVSGGTVTLAVIVAAGSAAMTFPASCIEARIGVSVMVAAAGVIASAAAVLLLSSFNIDMEVAAAVVSAMAGSVAFAAAWAVGVMSLIEKETHQVGLKMTSILDAVRRNNFRILKLLLKLNSGLKQRDLDLALLHAVKAGFQECTEVLLLAGANPNARDCHDNTPLTHACETGGVKILKTLLNGGADIGLRDGNRGTCLHHAAKWGYEGCVQELLSQGADCDVQDGLWHTPLMLVIKHAQQPESIVYMLLSNGCDVNIMGSEQRTAIHLAAIRGLDIEPLLKVKGDPYLQDAEGNSPLHYAAMEGHLITVQKLLGVCCDPNMSNFQRRSPVHFAAIKGRTTCLKELVAAMGNPFLKDSAGRLPLWYAAVNGSFESCKYLVQINCLLRQPRTVVACNEFKPHELLRAVLEKENLAIVKLLVIGGCNTKPVSDWIVQMRPSLWTDSNVEHLIWLKEYVQNPVPLCNICRLVIRQMMGTRFKQNVLYLPLPKSLKHFLSMRELDYWLEDGTLADSNQWQAQQKLNMI